MCFQYLVDLYGVHLSTVVKHDLSVSINFNDVVKFCIHDYVDGSCKGFCEMNLHSQVALFYQLKGSNFRHVGCEIKSKQGVSFGIIFSRNGISFILMHFSGTGVESHITSDVAIVFEVGM